MILRRTLPLALVGFLLAGPVQAQWHDDPMGRGGMNDDLRAQDRHATTSRPSGRVTVTRLRSADAAATLGHGGIAIGAGDPANTGLFDGLPIYEAAVASQLARAGYDTQVSAPSATPGASSQVAEITLSHAEVRPAEARHKPVSGAAETYLSNRGSGIGLALNLDFSKPKGPVISTRLDVRIRDRATNAVLWEGHAETAAYETAEGLDNTKTAARLSEALFAGFPNSATVVAAQ
jgi:hypothetical protein